MGKKILFDLDGTLTDSGEGIMNCFVITMKHFGLPVPTKEEMRVIIGPPLRDSFRRFGVSEENMEEAVLCYRDHYNDTGRLENFPYPGIDRLLARLKADGHKLYVATSKPESMSFEILTRFGLAQYFDIICGATVDGSRNTKEAVISYLLAQLPDKENLVMVGDTIYDVIGANAHGIPTYAVTWGYGDRIQMQAAGALLVDTMEELYARITQE